MVAFVFVGNYRPSLNSLRPKLIGAPVGSWFPVDKDPRAITRRSLVAPMGQVMATADGFSTREEAQTAIQWVKDSVAECPVQFRGTREMNP